MLCRDHNNSLLLSCCQVLTWECSWDLSKLHVTNTHQAERHKDEAISSCVALNHVKVGFDQSDHLIFISVLSFVDLSKIFRRALEE